MTHDLPLPDYDNLPTEAIGTRARTLDRQGVQTLLDYEQAHAGTSRRTAAEHPPRRA